MALFSRTKKSAAKPAGAALKPDKSATSPIDRDLSGVLQKPRISEKAVGKSEQNVYTFIIRQDATKYDVADAVRQLYAVTPVKVNIVNKAPRQVFSRSKARRISERGLRKAYVYLKSGDTINFV